MQTDTIIVGQGLCGTWLSYWLWETGADFVVIDEQKINSASKVASGIINPVTGRRMVKTWLADELIPFAEVAYNNMGNILGANYIQQTSMLDFFSAPDRRLSFENRTKQFESYLSWPEDEHKWLHYFHYPFGYGIIDPIYRIDIRSMLIEWKELLIEKEKYIGEQLESNLLKLRDNKVYYKDIIANRIIFCDGVAAMKHHFFNALPFAINKGEALIVEIEDLPGNHLYKKTNVIAPWYDGLFWVGSSYDRNFTDDQPTEVFLQQTTAWLKSFLKPSFTVVDHLAALRPTTVERRPFAGMHPYLPSVGIFNGMGTKGVSLAPYLAKQLALHILNGQELIPEADIKQYTRILKRKEV